MGAQLLPRWKGPQLTEAGIIELESADGGMLLEEITGLGGAPDLKTITVRTKRVVITGGVG